jgi:hypothetical protein
MPACPSLLKSQTGLRHRAAVECSATRASTALETGGKGSAILILEEGVKRHEKRTKT